MTSVTDIANLALARIGAEAIADISSANQRAVWCKRFYDQALQSVLREHPWNCCKKRAALTVLSSEPAFGYAYQYQLPGDCLRVLAMEYNDQAFVIEGRKLLTDEDTCNITYIYKPESPSEIGPMVIECIVAKLAAMIAFPIVQSKTLAKELNEELITVLLPKAKSVDAMESSVITTDDLNGESTWINSRI